MTLCLAKMDPRRSLIFPHPCLDFAVHTVRRERRSTGIKCDGMRRQIITSVLLSVFRINLDTGATYRARRSTRPSTGVVDQAGSSDQHHSHEEAHRTSGSEPLARIENKEDEQRFENKPTVVALDAELEHDKNTKWLRGCEWPA